MDLKKDISWRLGVIYLLVTFVSALILIRIFYLQFIDNEKWEAEAEKLKFKYELTNPDRGDICASDGRILATSVSFFDIFMDLGSKSLADSTYTKHIGALSDSLSNFFNIKTKEGYLAEFQTAKADTNKYLLIKRNVSYEQLKRLKKFPVFKYGQYKGGLIVEKKIKRIHPFGELAFRTIGYARGDIAVGLEGSFDYELKGNNVRTLMRKIGRNWIPVSEENNFKLESGKDIITTIDIDLQDYAHKSLLNQMTKFEAEQGVVVLMEVETGNIKAIVNLKKNSEGEFRESYNIAIGERTEPGSTFKLPALMVALEDGYIDLDDSIDTRNGVRRYHGFQIKDTKQLGKITVKQVFEHSSNVGVSSIIYEAYNDKREEFVKRLYSMNLNEPVGIEIVGERPPQIKSPKTREWSNISLPQMSIGYEVLLTPLQTLNFFNTIANNGKMMRPKLVQALRHHGEIVEVKKNEIINPSICSHETIQKAQAMLLGVVENGTAHNIRSPNYKIAGKTGTAQIARGQSGYRDTANRIMYQASFAGYFPAEKPKYSCIVLIKTKSNTTYYGSAVAAPVFKLIADKVYASSFYIPDSSYNRTKETPYSKDGNRTDLDRVYNELRVPVRGRNNVRSAWVVTKRHERYVEYGNRLISRSRVPKVKGMALKDALYILENLGMKVIVRGRGIITRQSVQPGTVVRNNQRIILELS
ncbi:MAG: hypothetical protein B6I20_03910 [Bacteroidetes bacterium 4572_117]|nr:MAG: hypothetical protein B6I20_03910 [Bacteroidetes bacterium 4572_117]